MEINIDRKKDGKRYLKRCEKLQTAIPLDRQS
jgi:hypothetical protein